MDPLTLDECLTCAIGGYKRHRLVMRKGWKDGNQYRRTKNQRMANDILAYFGEYLLTVQLDCLDMPKVTSAGGPDVTHLGVSYEAKSTIGKSGHLLVPADTPGHWVCVLIIGLPPHGLRIAGWMTAAEAKQYPQKRAQYRAGVHWVPQSALYAWEARCPDPPSK